MENKSNVNNNVNSSIKPSILPSTLPLYDDLIKEVEKLKEEPDIPKMSAIINSLKSEKSLHIMVLIHHYAILHGLYTPGKTPLNGKIFNGSKGVKYQISDLPPDLRKILWIFIDGPMIK